MSRVVLWWLAAAIRLLPPRRGMAGAGNMFVLLIPAAAGAYLGRGLRRSLRRAR